MNIRSALIAVCCLLTLATQLPADDIAVAGREVLSRNQDALVTVRLIIKSSYGGRESRQESRVETTGVVVDSSGLTVVSLSAVDPAETMNRTRAGSSDADAKYESELTDAKIMLSDETEVPAEVVLRDKDLDLAYLRPTEKLAKPIRPMDLGGAGRPEALDQVIVLKRLGKVANRIPTACAGRVEAVLSKPREFYLLAQASAIATLGSPVFSLDGKLLGILLMRTVKTSGDTSTGMGRNVLPVIVPAADILDGAKQVPDAKKPATSKSD